MPANRQKLELTWVGKDERPRLEPRILLPDDARSHHAAFRNSPRPSSPLPSGEGSGVGMREDLFDNRLIFGDNLLALKALEQEFAGKIKCVFIDPPYNTGSAFTHYDDGLEHSLWLTMMRDRLELLRNLLSDDGSIWITIDDNEAHYLKVLCDEIFGRANFVANVVWQKKYAVKSDSEFFSVSHDFVLIFAKNLDAFHINRFPRTEDQDARYQNPDNDPRGNWASGPLQRNEARDYAIFPITSPKTGKQHWPPKGTSWRFTKERIQELIDDNRIWFGEKGNNVPRLKRFLSEVEETVPPTTWWDYSNFSHNDEARRETKRLFETEELFATPKPERLLKSIVQLATNPGDWVLDSFAGSGTTGAVAHKMGRRWIMIELGEHCHTHIIPRLQKVIDGADQGGISKAVGWRGGGGFRYYTLAPSLLAKDKWGNWVINAQYAPAMLAEAVCKLEGFTYAPSDSAFWQHGHSTERDFIYVTTQTLTREQLAFLSEEVGRERTLLACCGAVRAARADEFDNLTVKKIPQAVLDKCEYGHDDYSLAVAALPPAEPDAGQISLL